MARVLPDHSTSASYLGTHDAGNISSDTCEKMVKQSCPRVIFMDIANDAKKILLTKIVEELGGSVTCDGSDSTHIITPKARRTLNFSIALCSGAWIVSPNWLKSSFKEGRFAEESQFILEDEDYLLKYKTRLRDAVERSRRNPHSLLRGYDVCLAKHIQPSAATLSAIIQSAGGNVIKSLSSILEPSKTIFLACEEDMSEAMVAAKECVWTFSSEWLMNCVMTGARSGGTSVRRVPLGFRRKSTGKFELPSSSSSSSSSLLTQLQREVTPVHSFDGICAMPN